MLFMLLSKASCVTDEFGLWLVLCFVDNRIADQTVLLALCVSPATQLLHLLAPLHVPFATRHAMQACQCLQALAIARHTAHGDQHSRLGGRGTSVASPCLSLLLDMAFIMQLQEL